MRISSKNLKKLDSTLSVEPIKIFLSYSSEEKYLAGAIKANLGIYGFHVFLAHEDLQPLSEWEGEILDSLKNCDIFSCLLSTKFRDSEWTSQEIGYALALSKTIVPLKLDSDPYGFIKRYQAFTLSEYDVSDRCKQIVGLIQKKGLFGRRMQDMLINALRLSNNFDEATSVLEVLEGFRKFDKSQMDEVFRNAIWNNQVRMSRKGKDLLHKWYFDYSSELDPFLKSTYEGVQDSFHLFIDEEES